MPLITVQLLESD